MFLRQASRWIAASCAMILLVATSVSGQTATGMLDGVVVDADGLRAPGVTVVANGPALIQRDLTMVSDETGYYRFPLLPPGEYVLIYSLQGFQRLERAGLIVRAGSTLTIDVALSPATLSEAVTVVGESPTLDQRGAKLAFNYDSQLAENIPTNRNFHGLVATIPGVESAGNYGVLVPGNIDVQNVLGAGSRANSYTLDGANTTDAAGQWNVAALFSFDIIEEVQVVKAAKPAEVGYQGGLFSVVTKSGGNQFSGEIGSYFQDDALQATNASTVLQDAGVQTSNRLKNDYEATASMGGKFVEDQLWWYGSVRRQDGTSTLFGFPEDVTNEINAYFGKLTFQANENHSLTAMASHWDQTVNHFFFNFSPAQAGDAMASVYRPLHGNTYAVRWSGILGDHVIAEAGWSTTEQGLNQDFQPGSGVAVIDVATGKRFHNSGEGSRVQDFDTFSYKGSLSWFVPEAGGRHNVKVGFEYLPTNTFILFDDLGDHRLNVANGFPVSVRILNTPTNATWDIDHASVYAQDSWTIRDRLTLNYGLRFDRTHAQTPEEVTGGGDFAGTALAVRFPQLERTVLAPTELITWNDVAPRFAATYSLDDAGRTVVRASASRYAHHMPAFDLFVSNPAFPFNFVTRWNDLNGDRRFQVGEDGVLFAQFGGNLNPIDPDIRRPHTNEFIVGVSHEPMEDVSVGASVIYREDRDLLNLEQLGVPASAYAPVDVVDPGPDGVVGGGDDGALTVYAQDPATISSARQLLTNTPGNDRTYKGLELTATKRLSNDWQAVASLVVSEMEVIQRTGPESRFLETPNSLLNAKGKDPNNHTVQFKLQGTYIAPYEVFVSAFYRYLTGLPYTRELLVQGLPQGPITVFAEPRGSSEVDDQSIVDVRVEKRFDLTGNTRLGLMLDIFNVTNASPVLVEGSLTGGDYGEPQAVWTPRIARIGLRLSW